MLVQKIYPQLRCALVAAAALGAYRAIRLLLRSAPTRRVRQLTSLCITVLAAVLVTVSLQYVLVTVRGNSLRSAYAQADPAGQVSEYAETTQSGASADQIAATIGRDPDQVVLSGRIDIFSFIGYWSFNQITPNYAHPGAQYAERLALIEQMGQETDPSRAYQLVTENKFDRIDALVLAKDDHGGLSYRHLRLNYPQRSVKTSVTFERSVFADPRLFEVTDLDRWVVIKVRAAATGE